MKQNRKNALILGSSKGLGFACAKELSSEYNIILVSRNLESLNNAKKNLDKVNSKASIKVHKCDISSKEEREYLFKKIESIDILVSNTGGPLFGSIFNNLTVYKDTHNDFLVSQIHIIENYINQMKKNKWGRIIVISSSILKSTNDNLHLSHIYRSALSGYVTSRVKNLIVDNITINTILAGSFDTERTRSYIKMISSSTNKSLEKVREEMELSIPIKRLGKPEELASLCKYLAEDNSSFLTGQHITLDGGVTSVSFA